MNDGTTARTTDGLVADFTTAEYIRAVAEINSLTETQFAVVNNDIAPTIKGIFDTSQIIIELQPPVVLVCPGFVPLPQPETAGQYIFSSPSSFRDAG